MADKLDYVQLRAIMDTLLDGTMFRLRQAPFEMQGAGGLGQPDVVNFIGYRYVGVDEEAEKKLWEYINSLPAHYKKEISGWFGYLKDEYKHKEK